MEEVCQPRHPESGKLLQNIRQRARTSEDTWEESFRKHAASTNPGSIELICPEI